LVRARRKCNAVAGAGFEKWFDVSVGEKRLVPEEFCDEGGFCKLLNSFHPTTGSEKIGAGRDHTVIGHEDGVVMRHESSEGFAKPGRARCGVLSQRDTTGQADNLRQPEVGTIYVVGDKPWIDATPIARAVNFSDFAIQERDHNQS
jgi:hypothetical protein